MNVAERERIVIYRLGSLGDTVVALPCLHRVAAEFPQAERIMLTNFPVSSKAAPLAAILGGSGLVDQFIAYPVGTRSLKALAELRTSLRTLNARTLVYLTPSRGLAAAWRDVVFFRLCGFSRIIGAPLTRDLQANRVSAEGWLEWECQRLARSIASRLGPVDLDDRHAWDLRLTAAERGDATTALGPAAGQALIAINMGGKVVKNDWGEDNWAALLTCLRETHGDRSLMIVGGPEDGPRAEQAARVWPGPVVNLCGKTSPRVSAAAMSGAELFIGHDSGPLHLAACVGVRCVGLFGDHYPPRKWHPYGVGHRILHDMRGVRAITVQSVVDAVKATL